MFYFPKDFLEVLSQLGLLFTSDGRHLFQKCFVESPQKKYNFGQVVRNSKFQELWEEKQNICRSRIYRKFECFNKNDCSKQKFKRINVSLDF